MPESTVTEPTVTGHVEIACDESGFSGGNLVGTRHPTAFAHASVRIDAETAGELLARVRTALEAKSGEYKSAELFRPRHRQTLRWLLESSPLPAIARVHLTDTRLFVIARVLDILLDPNTTSGMDLPGRGGTRETALTLYRVGDEAYGSEQWQHFLLLAANMLRTNSRWLPKLPVPEFYAAVDALVARNAPGAVGRVVARLAETRPVAEATRAAHLESPRPTPLLEPLLPALARAVDVWGSTASSISVVHDEQSALTPGRVTELGVRFANRHPGHRLVGVRRVDSREDARIQIADFLAGIAHRLARDELRGRADPELLALLRPLVDPESVWVGRLGAR